MISLWNGQIVTDLVCSSGLLRLSSSDSFLKPLKMIVGGLASDPGKTLLLTAAGSSEIPDLSCTDHKEADTRILAHISCVNQYGYQRAVIQATDIDIFTMAIYYSVRIPGLKELWN